MKSLIITLLIFGCAFLVFDFFITPPAERRVFSPAPTAAPVAPVQSQSAPAPDAPPASPVVVTASPGGFTAPPPDTLETLTKNWTVIPASAFPRAVKLARDTEFKMSAGSSRLTAGASAVALACEQGVLTLAPTETSTARGQARVADTDLPAQLAESYRKWAIARVETLRAQWARKRSAAEPPTISVSGGVDETGKPARDGNGAFPLLLASMTSGQVTEITPKKMKRWGTPVLKTVDGRPTWTVEVSFDTIVFCGEVEARAEAHVRDGKVIRWIYPGSGEPVP